METTKAKKKKKGLQKIAVGAVLFGFKIILTFSTVAVIIIKLIIT